MSVGVIYLRKTIRCCVAGLARSCSACNRDLSTDDVLGQYEMRFDYKEGHLSGNSRLWLRSDATFSQLISGNDGERLECEGTWSSGKSLEAGFYLRLINVCDVNKERSGSYSLERVNSAEVPVQAHWRSVELRRDWDRPEFSCYKQKK